MCLIIWAKMWVITTRGFWWNHCDTLPHHIMWPILSHRTEEASQMRGQKSSWNERSPSAFFDWFKYSPAYILHLEKGTPRNAYATGSKSVLPPLPQNLVTALSLQIQAVLFVPPKPSLPWRGTLVNLAQSLRSREVWLMERAMAEKTTLRISILTNIRAKSSKKKKKQP